MIQQVKEAHFYSTAGDGLIDAGALTTNNNPIYIIPSGSYIPEINEFFQLQAGELDLKTFTKLGKTYCYDANLFGAIIKKKKAQITSGERSN